MSMSINQTNALTLVWRMIKSSVPRASKNGAWTHSPMTTRQVHTRQPYLRSAVSLARFDGRAAGSSNYSYSRNAHAMDWGHPQICCKGSPYHKKYILRNSSSTLVHNTLPDVTDKNDAAPVEVEKKKLDTTVQPEDTIQSLSEFSFDTSHPFQSDTQKLSGTESSGSGDDRSRAKLVALSKAEKDAIDAQSAFLECMITCNGEKEELYKRWKLSAQNLGLAYSQAIKYTSRIHQDDEATKTAERLMYQWMDRVMESFGSSLVWMKDIEDAVEDSSTMYLNKKWMIRTIHSIVPRLTNTSKLESSPSEDIEVFPKIRLPPPSSKDYINLLRAYSNSKARRKGQQCEALMKSMMLLANIVSCQYDTNEEELIETDTFDIGRETVVGIGGKETQLWKMWVHESIPNSKVFALAIKVRCSNVRRQIFCALLVLSSQFSCFHVCQQCHAGTTRKYLMFDMAICCTPVFPNIRFHGVFCPFHQRPRSTRAHNTSEQHS